MDAEVPAKIIIRTIVTLVSVITYFLVTLDIFAIIITDSMTGFRSMQDSPISALRHLISYTAFIIR